MKYRVKLEPRAKRDAESLYRWVILQAPHQGALWHRGLMDAVLSLARHPQRCPLAPEFKPRRKIRQLFYGKRPYRILFRIEGDEIQILHIRRGRRGRWVL